MSGVLPVHFFSWCIYIRNVYLLGSCYVPGRAPAIGEGVVDKT